MNPDQCSVNWKTKSRICSTSFYKWAIEESQSMFTFFEILFLRCTLDTPSIRALSCHLDKISTKTLHQENRKTDHF